MGSQSDSCVRSGRRNPGTRLSAASDHASEWGPWEEQTGGEREGGEGAGRAGGGRAWRSSSTFVIYSG